MLRNACEHLIAYEEEGKLVVRPYEYSRSRMNAEDYEFDRRCAMSLIRSSFMKHSNIMRRTAKNHIEKKLFFSINRILTFRNLQTAKQASHYGTFDDDFDVITSKRDMNDASVALDMDETERGGPEKDERNRAMFENLINRFPHFSLTLYYPVEVSHLFMFGRERKESVMDSMDLVKAG